MTKRRTYSDDEIRAALEASRGNIAATARALGANERSLRRRIKAMRGDLEAPDGFMVTGKSTLIDRRTGETVLEWVKISRDAERQAEMLREVVEAIASELPRERPAKAPETGDADLLNCFIVTDYHLGMYSWAEETGDDWDTDIAEGLLVDWFAAAIRSAPNADTAIFAQLGDFLHWDGMDAVTPASKHLLDADTRFQRLVRVAIRAIRRIVRMLLEKHRHVHLIMAEGNHDPASSIWLRELFAALYEDEPRVSIDKSADPYYCYEWGKTSLFFHHGHKRKPTNIDDVFVGKFRQVFGRTKYSYAHMGHMHHLQALETTLMVVEQHRTLASPDAYASRGGWMSGRSASVITYSREFGEVGRVVISPEMVTSIRPRQ